MFKDISSDSERKVVDEKLLDVFYPGEPWNVCAHDCLLEFMRIRMLTKAFGGDWKEAERLTYRFLSPNPTWKRQVYERVALRTTKEEYRLKHKCAIVGYDGNYWHMLAYTSNNDIFDLDDQLAAMAPFVERRDGVYRIPEDVW